MMTWSDLDLFYGKVKFGNLGFSIGKVKIVDFSETIAACDLKVGRCRQLMKIMKVCEIEGQSHFFTIYFPGLVCFVLY